VYGIPGSPASARRIEILSSIAHQQPFIRLTVDKFCSPIFVLDRARMKSSTALPSGSRREENRSVRVAVRSSCRSLFRSKCALRAPFLAFAETSDDVRVIDIQDTILPRAGVFTRGLITGEQHSTTLISPRAGATSPPGQVPCCSRSVEKTSATVPESPKLEKHPSVRVSPMSGFPVVAHRID